MNAVYNANHLRAWIPFDCLTKSPTLRRILQSLTVSLTSLQLSKSPFLSNTARQLTAPLASQWTASTPKHPNKPNLRLLIITSFYPSPLFTEITQTTRLHRWQLSRNNSKNVVVTFFVKFSPYHTTRLIFAQNRRHYLDNCRKIQKAQNGILQVLPMNHQPLSKWP